MPIFVFFLAYTILLPFLLYVLNILFKTYRYGSLLAYELPLYSGGGAMAAHKAHNLKTRFESYVRNQGADISPVHIYWYVLHRK